MIDKLVFLQGAFDDDPLTSGNYAKYIVESFKNKYGELPLIKNWKKKDPQFYDVKFYRGRMKYHKQGYCKGLGVFYYDRVRGLENIPKQKIQYLKEDKGIYIEKLTPSDKLLLYCHKDRGIYLNYRSPGPIMDKHDFHAKIQPGWCNILLDSRFGGDSLFWGPYNYGGRHSTGWRRTHSYVPTFTFTIEDTNIALETLSYLKHIIVNYKKYE